MKARITAILLFMLSFSPVAYAGEYVNPADTVFVPIPVVLIHGMASAPNTWTTLTEKLQPLVQDGSFAISSASFRYGFPSDTPELESRDTIPAAPDSSYFQTVHYGRHGVLQGIPIQSGNQQGPFFTDPLDALKTVAVRPFDNDIRSVLESVNAALLLQKNMGIAPARRFVILVGHSTGGLAIRKFMQEMGDSSPSSPQGNPALSDMTGITYETVVKRIVFVDVPHRGSPLANYIRYIADMRAKLNSGPSDTELSFSVQTNSYPWFVPTDSSTVPDTVREQLRRSIQTASPAAQWETVAIDLINEKLGGPPDGPIFELLSVPEPHVFTETIVSDIVITSGWTNYQAKWIVQTPYVQSFPLEPQNLPEASNNKTVLIVGRSASAQIGNAIADDPEIIGEGAAYSVSGGMAPTGYTTGTLLYLVQTRLGQWWTGMPTLPNSIRDISLKRSPGGTPNFSSNYNLDDLRLGDGIVSLQSQEHHGNSAISIQDEWAHIEGAYKAGATANWQPILNMMWDAPATVDTLCASQYIDPTDSALKSYLIFSIDDLYPADVTLAGGPTVSDAVSGNSYSPQSSWPTAMYRSDSTGPRRIGVDQVTNYGGFGGIYYTVGDTGIYPISKHFYPPNAEFWPYGALGDTMFRRRVTKLLSPNGETIALGPGQFALEMTFLSQNAKETGEFSLTVSGRTRNVIPRETTFVFASVAVPPYVEAVKLTAANGDSQNSGVAMRHNSPGSNKDTWSRVVTADTRLLGVSGGIAVTVTFNQPFARDSVSMFLWNGTDTPRITLTPISGQQDRTLTGTIAAETLAHTKVGVYPLAVSCTGPNPLAPHLDGDPTTIAWYDPIADTYRGV